MGIGQSIGAGSMSLAADLTFAAAGVMVLITVIAGFLILTGLGGQGIQKTVRQYILVLFFAALFFGAANRIATSALAMFSGGTGG